MNSKARVLSLARTGSLCLGVVVAAAFLTAASAAQAKETDPGVPNVAGPALISVTAVMTSGQVAPLMVLSGPLPDIPANYMIVEGDIQIPKSVFSARYRASTTDGGQGTQPSAPSGTFETNRWQNGVVPYEFDANVTAGNQAAAQQAMTDWEGIANVHFNQCANNTCGGDFVHVQSSNANNSATGRQGGLQVVNLFDWNSRYIIAHELGHALGLEHEQSRPDRIGFVQINLNNVCKATDTSCNGGFCFDGNGARIDCDFNFDIQPTALTYGAYDFDSVMHYDRLAYSRNGSDTITVFPPFDTQWQNAIGQRTHLSQGDQLAMSCLYPPSNWRWVSAAAKPVQLGDCLNPYSAFPSAVALTPADGILWIEPGNYSATGTYNQAITIKAPNGLAILTP